MITLSPEDRARQIELVDGRSCWCWAQPQQRLCPTHQQIADAIRAGRADESEARVRAFHLLTSREWDFVRALLADSLDVDTLSVFADWLEENGRDEVGRRVRLLRPQTGDVLVWTYPMAGIAQTAGDMIESIQRRVEANHAAHAIQNDLKRLGREVAVAVHSDRAGLEVVPSEDMRRQGWVPAAEAERLEAERDRLRFLLREILPWLAGRPCAGLAARINAALSHEG